MSIQCFRKSKFLWLVTVFCHFQHKNNTKGSDRVLPLQWEEVYFQFGCESKKKSSQTEGLVPGMTQEHQQRARDSFCDKEWPNYLRSAKWFKKYYICTELYSPTSVQIKSFWNLLWTCSILSRTGVVSTVAISSHRPNAQQNAHCDGFRMTLIGIAFKLSKEKTLVFVDNILASS